MIDVMMIENARSDDRNGTEYHIKITIQMQEDPHIYHIKLHEVSTELIELTLRSSRVVLQHLSAFIIPLASRLGLVELICLLALRLLLILVRLLLEAHVADACSDSSNISRELFDFSNHGIIACMKAFFLVG
jgi:hypothetical protein